VKCPWFSFSLFALFFFQHTPSLSSLSTLRSNEQLAINQVGGVVVVEEA